MKDDIKVIVTFVICLVVILSSMMAGMFIVTDTRTAHITIADDDSTYYALSEGSLSFYDIKEIPENRTITVTLQRVFFTQTIKDHASEYIIHIFVGVDGSEVYSPVAEYTVYIKFDWS